MKARIRTYLVVIVALGLGVPAPSAAQVADRLAAPAEEDEGPLFSPRGAFLRSLALPGWGHVYAQSPGRGAVYFSLTSGSVWMAYVSRRQLLDARREQAWLRSTGQLEPTEETEFAIARASQFEDWAILSIALFFIAGADAYVAAYLADFDDRIGVRPGPDRSLQIEARIPFPARP